MMQHPSKDILTVGDWHQTGGGGAAMDPSHSEMVDVLFRRHYTALLRLGVVMVGSREPAEDAVQEAFASLYRNRQALRDVQAAEAYLRSAVLNRCRSWMRRQVTQRTTRPLMLVRQQHEGPEEEVIDRDEVGMVVASMRKLSRRQREVLACRYVLELSIAETAQLLDISEGSVKTHAHRGIKALHEQMEVTR